MSNRVFEIYISEKEIYDKLLPEQKERFNNVRVVDAYVTPFYKSPNSGGVYIKCLALESEITECTSVPCMSFDKEDGYINIDEI